MKCRWCAGTGDRLGYGEGCEHCYGSGETADSPFPRQLPSILSQHALREICGWLCSHERHPRTAIHKEVQQVAMMSAGVFLPDDEAMAFETYWVTPNRDETVGDWVEQIAERAFMHMTKSI